MFVGERPNACQQYAVPAQKANCNLGWVKRGVASRARKVIVPLCSALMRACLENHADAWGSQQEKNEELLKQVQMRAVKMSGSGAPLCKAFSGGSACSAWGQEDPIAAF